METLSALLVHCEGNNRSSVVSLTKDQWCRALSFPLLLAWTSCWTNRRDSDDLRRQNAKRRNCNGTRVTFCQAQFPTMNSEPVEPTALIWPAPSIHLNLSFLLTWTMPGPATWLMMMDLYLSVQRIITVNVVPHDHVMIWKRFRITGPLWRETTVTRGFTTEITSYAKFRCFHRS